MTLQRSGQSGDQNDGFDLDERDRLPWLEPAGHEEDVERVSGLRIVGLAVLGLALLGLIIGGGYWLKNRGASGGGGENATLIAAQSRSYKIPANASDAKEFDGEGDAAFEASEGGEETGRIDASRVPEEPRTDLRAIAKPAEPAPKPIATNAKPMVAAAVKTVAADPKKAALTTGSAATGNGEARIQLGALGSKAIAEDVWKKLSGRFDYLAELTHSVEPVETGGKTLFRLRATVASPADASGICGKLRVAGENCMVVR